jgi:hypothetical protein
MRLSRSQCEQFRRVCSGSLAETTGAIAESVTDAVRIFSQRHVTTSAVALRFHGVKDPVSHAGAVTGEASHVPFTEPYISYYLNDL